MTEPQDVPNVSRMVAVDAGKYLTEQVELEHLRAEVERLQTAHGVYAATVAKVTALQAENERLRKIIPEICPHCGGRMDVDPGHIERCYCLPVIRTLHAENERLQRTLRIVDEWLAATLPGSSSESMRALIRDALRGEKPA